MRGHWDLTDEQWAVVEPVLRPVRRADKRGRPWHDTRAVLHGVLWVLCTGAQWRELPEGYPAFPDLSPQLLAMGMKWEAGTGSAATGAAPP